MVDQEEKYLKLEVKLSETLIYDRNAREELLCGMCDNYLSVSPVYNIANIGFVCGRCEHVEFEKIINNPIIKERQWIYESMAKYITFPCFNELNGCDEKLKWGEVENHEESCVYTKKSCLFSKESNYCDDNNEEKCEWTGEFHKLNQHLEKVHNSKFVDLPLKLQMMDELKGKLILTKISGKLFAIIFKFTEAFYCYIVNFQNNENIDYDLFKLQIVDGNNIFSFDTRKYRISERNFALVYKESVKNKVINMSFLEDLSRGSYISLEIFKQTIIKNHNNLIIDDVPNCDSCKNRLYPPTFMCQKNHKLCKICTNSETNCPTCDSSFDVNENQDKISEISDYRCKNYVKGCSYIDKLDTIHKHESICSLNEYECEVTNCTWKGILQLFHSHCQTVHIYYTRMNNFHPLEQVSGGWFYLFDDQVFLVNQNHTERKIGPGSYLSFQMSCLTQQELFVTYVLELAIRNRRQNSEKLSVTYFIKPSFIDLEKRTLKIHGEFLEQFCFDESLEHSINISKL